MGALCLTTLLLACGSTRRSAVEGIDFNVGEPRVASGGNAGSNIGLVDAATGAGEVSFGGSSSSGGTGGWNSNYAGGAGASVLNLDGGVSEPTYGAFCGDNLVNQSSEACDGNEGNCRFFGFDEGLTTCRSDCRWDLANCSGTEQCFDGRDNDGDGLVDCLDEGDCKAECLDPCLSVVSLSANDWVEGTTLGHGTAVSASCTIEGGGSTVVYQLTSAEDGKLDLALSGDVAFSLSVGSSCGEISTEQSCTNAYRLTLDVLEAQTIFVTVQATEAEQQGRYVLVTEFRQPACGDGIRDAEEVCDDGNINDGDGCDPDCNLETLESEPNNNSLLEALPFSLNNLAAEIRPAGDVDFHSVTLTDASTTLVVQAFNLGDGACALELMDTVVDVFDTNQNGNQLILSNDNGGDGLCARAIVPGLPPGTYYVRVAAAASAQPNSFPYIFRADLAVCGDNELGAGEECDDGNLQNGDNCSDECRVEL